MQRLRNPVIIVWLAVGFYFLVFSVLSILKHLSLHSSYLDLGLESQIVWNSSRGRWLETSFGPEGQRISALSFHVSPISLLLLPLYWFWPDPIALLILQTVALALGAWPVFWLAQSVVGTRFLPLALVTAYLLYPPLQYSNLSDFHPQTLATPALLFAFWFLYRKKFWSLYLMIVLGLLIKENIALILTALSLYMIIGMREKRRGLVVLLISLIWFLATLYWVLPFFSNGQMGAFDRYTYLGRTPLAAVWSLVTNPVRVFQILFDLPKVKYLFHLLVSVGFLPLFSLPHLLVSLSEFTLNLFSSYNPQWQVKFHYTAAITPFVFVAAVFGLARVHRWLLRHGYKNAEPALAVYLVVVALVWNVVHSPSPINYKFDRKAFALSSTTRLVIEKLRSLPSSASVSAMNNLGAHLSTRRELYRFPIRYQEADYIVVDPKLPEENFDLSQVQPSDFAGYLAKLRGDQSLQLITSLERLYVFERIKK